jgi:hypothetical protein
MRGGTDPVAAVYPPADPSLSLLATMSSSRSHTVLLHGSDLALLSLRCARRRKTMNIFYIIGVVVVVLFVLGYFGLR